jgi:hypothetical protein
MKTTIWLAACTVVLGGAALAQEAQPYAGMDARSIKTLSEQQVDDLRAGRGMGLALAAELNGYPGPSHAIELSASLQLSSDQVAKLGDAVAAMKAETIPIGELLISQERDLNEEFASQRITPASLQAAVEAIGATQAVLRGAHLKYHLSTAAILTPEQIRRYAELRGYGSSSQLHQHHPAPQ